MLVRSESTFSANWSKADTLDCPGQKQSMRHPPPPGSDSKSTVPGQLPRHPWARNSQFPQPTPKQRQSGRPSAPSRLSARTGLSSDFIPHKEKISPRTPNFRSMTASDCHCCLLVRFANLSTSVRLAIASCGKFPCGSSMMLRKRQPQLGAEHHSNSSRLNFRLRFHLDCPQDKKVDLYTLLLRCVGTQFVYRTIYRSLPASSSASAMGDRR